MQFNYQVIIEREDDSVFLNFPDFPEIISEWEPEEVTEKTVETLARNALMNAIQARIDFGDEIPHSSEDKPEGIVIYLSPTVTAKLSLYTELLKRGVPASNFSTALQLRPTDKQRLLDIFHESRSEQITAAFATLGLRLSINATVVSEEFVRHLDHGDRKKKSA